MFTHTGPRRGDVFAESTFAKQIAMIEAGLIPPVIKVGNLDSFTKFQVKILMRSSNQSKVPTLKDLRVIAMVT